MDTSLNSIGRKRRPSKKIQEQEQEQECISNNGKKDEKEKSKHPRNKRESKNRERESTNVIETLHIDNESMTHISDDQKMDPPTLKVRTKRQKRVYKERETTDLSTSDKQSPKSVPARKTKAVYNAYNQSNNLAVESDDDNVIMQLKVNPTQDSERFKAQFTNSHMNGIDSHSHTFDPYCPSTFANADMYSNDLDIFMHVDTDREEELTPAKGLQVTPCDSTGFFKQLPKESKESGRTWDPWPKKTNVCCYWCCHSFPNTPFGIPLKYVEHDNVFHVIGCYCSLECTLAHNMSIKDQGDEMWERCNLIQLMSRKIRPHSNVVRPAPHKLALEMFGGHLSIEQFRNYTNSSKIIHVNFPPMVTVIQQIEEINESDVNNDSKYIPIDTDRIDKYKEQLRLRRSKPIHGSVNTLDNAINIKITKH